MQKTKVKANDIYNISLYTAGYGANKSDVIILTGASIDNISYG
jgi:hypothetical protein